jgi:Flp pilus assembly protein TadD
VYRHLGIFLFALGVRLLYLRDLDQSVLSTVLIGDAREYDAWARRIAGGEWLGSEVFYQSPLYPYFLAGVYLVFGDQITTVRVLQCLGGAVACVLVAEAGRRFFDGRAGLIAGLLIAVYGPAVFFDGLIQKSSLDLLFIAAVLCALGWFTHRPGWTWLVGAGVATGLLCVNRENARVLIPVIAGWLLLPGAIPGSPALRRRCSWAAIFVAAAAITVFPLGLRNYLVGGEFFVSTSQAGPNFFIGNHAGASGLYESLLPERGNAKYEREDAQRLAEQASARTLSPGEVSSYWFWRTVADIRDAPGRWLGLVGRKLLLVVSAGEVADAESFSAYAEQSHVLRSVAWINFGVLFPLAVLGAWLERARWRQLTLLYGCVLALAGSVALFFVFARYRYPMVPVLALFAAVPVSRLATMRSGGVARQWLPGVVLAAGAAIVSRLPLNLGGDETYLNLGRQLIADGRPDEAIRFLHLANEKNPEYAIPAFTLAVAYDRVGNKAAALDHFRRAASLDPHDSRTQGALGLALMEMGALDESRIHFSEAIRLAPDDAQLRTNFGLVLLQAGQAPLAVEHLRTAVRLAPDDAGARNALGSALDATGQLQEAIASFREALSLRPGYAEAHANLGLALARAGSLPDAIVALEQAARLQPTSVEIHYSLAQVFAQAGRRDDAVSELRLAYAAAVTTGRAEIAARIEATLAQLGARPR